MRYFMKRLVFRFQRGEITGEENNLCHQRKDQVRAEQSARSTEQTAGKRMLNDKKDYFI